MGAYSFTLARTRRKQGECWDFSARLSVFFIVGMMTFFAPVAALADSPLSTWDGRSDLVFGEIGVADPSVKAMALPRDRRDLLTHADHGLGITNTVRAGEAFPQPRTIEVSALPSAEEEQGRLQEWMRRSDRQPTGFYAPAGKGIKLTVEGQAPGLEVWVGTEGLHDPQKPTKQQEPRKTSLTQGVNRLTDAEGGIIHLRYVAPQGNASPVKVTIGEQAEPIAYFVHGNTTGEAWRKMLSQAKTPEVELVAEHVVIAVPRPLMQSFEDTDAQATLDAHEKVLAIEDEVSGLDGSTARDRRSPLKIYAVDGIFDDTAHATDGYISWPSDGFEPEELLTDKALHSWGIWHEYGHHKQYPTTTGLTQEVSVNIYGLEIARRGYSHAYTNELPKRWPATQKYFSRLTWEKRFESEVDHMAMYDQLRSAFGLEFYKTLFRFYRAHPVSPGPDTADDRAKLSFELTAMSAISGYDLSAFFNDWGILRTQATRQRIAALNLPNPPADLKKIEPYVAKDALVQPALNGEAVIPPLLGASPVLRHVSSGLCLDIKDGDSKDGGLVELYDCGGGWNQNWEFEGKMLINPSSVRCLGPEGGRKSVGTPVRLYNCNGSDGQQWEFKDAALRNFSSGYCLSLKDNNEEEGAPVQLDTCTGDIKQNWSVN